MAIEVAAKYMERPNASTDVDAKHTSYSKRDGRSNGSTYMSLRDAYMEGGVLALEMEVLTTGARRLIEIDLSKERVRKIIFGSIADATQKERQRA